MLQVDKPYRSSLSLVLQMEPSLKHVKSQCAWLPERSTSSRYSMHATQGAVHRSYVVIVTGKAGVAADDLSNDE
jgi:hypothetical protein